MRDELRSILTGWGIAAVLVTHDLAEAYRLGDRIVVYEEGRVIQAAPRAELLWQPSSRAVARIIYIRLDEPGAPAQGDYDLEVEVPRLVYEIFEIERDRHWRFSLHRGSIHVLPSG